MLLKKAADAHHERYYPSFLENGIIEGLCCNDNYISNNYLVFSISEFVENYNCFPLFNTKRCICHFDHSSLMRLDLSKGTLETMQNYAKGSIVVEYGSADLIHYYEGHVYKNNDVLNQCEIISVGEDVVIEGDNFSTVYDNDFLLTYYNDYFHFINIRLLD